MATHTANFATQITTDAEFRAVGTWINAIFALSFSNVYSNITWTTVTRTGVGTYAGKEIWSSNDSGGGLNNFFVQIEYGQAAGNAGWLQLRITVGWSHDGAGNLTGVTTTATAVAQGAVSAVNSTQYGSADAGRARLVYGLPSSTASAGLTLSIERLKESGAYVNKVVVATNGAAGGYSQVSKSGYAYPATGTTAGTLIPFSTTTTSIQDAYVCLGFHYPYSAGWGNKMRNFMMCPVGLLGSPGGTVTIPVGGTNFTYLITQPAAVQGLYGSGTSYNGLMLFQ